MSYILNALRKSEQERQAVNPDTVTSRIVVHQPPRHQHTSKLIAALLAVNLAILGYVLVSNQKTAPVADQATASAVKPVEAPPPRQIEPPPRAAKAAEPKKAPATAKIAETRTVVPASLPPVKPVFIPKHAVEAVKPEPAAPIQIVAKAEPIRNTAEQPEAPPRTNDLPFLEQLPSEFRNSVPDLSINVFSYSSTPSERFVMIDMVKYVPGQNIKDLLELKEIRPDGIVVNYRDRTFKIRRP